MTNSLTHSMQACSKSAAILLASLSIAACGPNPSGPSAVTVPQGAVLLQVQALPDSVLRAHYSGVKDRRRLVVRDAARWAELWNELTALQQPRPPVPVIDFSKETVIFASMGLRGTGGYSIQIPRVQEAGGALYATVREVRPGPACILTQAETAPVVAVRVRQHSGDVLFVEESETRSCT
jgi:hypothetical protein